MIESNMYKYDIKENSAINRWWLSEKQSRVYKCQACSFKGDINYTEEYVDRVYPVRKNFIDEHMIDAYTLEIFDTIAMDQFYLPFDNNRVGHSGFFHESTYLYFIGESYIYAEEAGFREFDLYTCGGIKVWLEEDHIITFKPYTRNIPSVKRLQLYLKKGLNRLRIVADDLGERDTNFFFEIRHKGVSPLKGALNIEQDVYDIYKIETFLNHCYFNKDVYHKGDLNLYIVPEILASEVEVQLRMNHVNKSYCLGKTIKINPTSKDIPISKICKLPFGLYYIELSIETSGMKLYRNLKINIYNQSLIGQLKNHEYIFSRKKEALYWICQIGANDPFKVLAMLETEQVMTHEIERLIHEIVDMINHKEDTSVLYIGVLLNVFHNYISYISSDLWERMEEAILNYRYWIDEKGNDVMWYFSETHALQFHIAQYLSGAMFKDKVFQVSQRKGKEQMAIGRGRLMNWFDKFFHNGYGDWNAITHMPTNLVGLFFLYDLSEDEEIRRYAKQCMDFTFRVMTYHSFKGKLSTSFGRAYEDDLKARELAETAFLEWITYGKGYINHHVRATTLYALSSYEPEDSAFDVMVKDDEAVIIKLKQGIKGTSIYTYKTKSYMLSSAQNLKPYQRGHQQHVMNIALGNSGVQCFINHPGELSSSGMGRPSYWAGNQSVPMVRQYHDVMMLRYEISEQDLVHYIHCYLPKDLCDQIVITCQDIYVAIDDGYLAMKFSHPIKAQYDGPETYKEIICHGLHHNIYVKCSKASRWKSFEEFCCKMKETPIEKGFNNTFRVMDIDYGLVDMNNSGELYVDDMIVPIYDENEILIERINIR